MKDPSAESDSTGSRAIRSLIFFGIRPGQLINSIGEKQCEKCGRSAEIVE